MDSKKLRVSALADAHSKEFDAMLLRHKNGIKSLQQRHAAEITNMKERQKRQIENLQKTCTCCGGIARSHQKRKHISNFQICTKQNFDVGHSATKMTAKNKNKKKKKLKSKINTTTKTNNTKIEIDSPGSTNNAIGTFNPSANFFLMFHF